jgi:hypothetical protein
VDMTLPWRLLGLPRNVKLDLESLGSLVRAPVGTAQVAVAIPGASRVTVSPKLSTSIASVLRSLEALGHLPDGTDIGGCQVVYLRRSVAPAELESVSLQGTCMQCPAPQLGLWRSGRIVVTGDACRVKNRPKGFQPTG